MKIIIPILVILLIYFVPLLTSFFRLRKIKSLIDVIGSYLNSIDLLINAKKDNSSNGTYYTTDYMKNFCTNIIKTSDYYSIIASIPLINSFLVYPVEISYNNDELKNFDELHLVLGKLISKRDYLFYNLKTLLNPIRVLVTILRIPSTLFSFLGFNFKAKPSAFINLIFWVLAYFLKMFSPEIKSFIQSFF